MKTAKEEGKILVASAHGKRGVPIPDREQQTRQSSNSEVLFESVFE